MIVKTDDQWIVWSSSGDVDTHIVCTHAPHRASKQILMLQGH